jgi:hypothetical protein
LESEEEDDFSGDSDLSEDDSDVDPYYGYYEEVAPNSKSSSNRSKEQHKTQKYM